METLENRIQRIKKLHRNERPRVLAIEWIEPFFTAGHWVPDMIETAGGVNMLSKTGDHSRRLNMQEIIETDPDIIIIMPCGFDTDRTVSEYNRILKINQDWKTLRAVKDKNVFAVDANSFFSKPSIRTVTGIEILSKIIQPEKTRDVSIPKNSFLQI